MDVLDLPDEAWIAEPSPEECSASREVVRAFFRHIREKDVNGLLTLMSPDIVIEIPFSESGRTEDGYFRKFEGPEAVREFWLGAFRAEGKSHGMSDVQASMSANGQHVFVEGRGHLTMTNGRSYRNRYVFRFELRDGKIKTLLEYYNPITAAHAFGRAIAAAPG